MFGCLVPMFVIYVYEVLAIFLTVSFSLILVATSVKTILYMFSLKSMEKGSKPTKNISDKWPNVYVI